MVFTMFLHFLKPSNGKLILVFNSVIVQGLSWSGEKANCLWNNEKRPLFPNTSSCPQSTNNLMFDYDLNHPVIILWIIKSLL